MNDYQDELTEKRRSAYWKALAKPKEREYTTLEDIKRRNRKELLDFGLGLLIGALIFATTILAMFAL